jgi:hypothetical protein
MAPSQILTTQGGVVLTTKGGEVLVTGPIIPPPIVPPSQLVDYIFMFGVAGQAANDPIIGPYLGKSGCNNVLLVDLTDDEIYGGYWPMISQYGPANETLYNHPSLRLAINRSLELQGEQSVLKAMLGNVGNLQILAQNGGAVHTNGGLF